MGVCQVEVNQARMVYKIDMFCACVCVCVFARGVEIVQVWVVLDIMSV